MNLEHNSRKSFYRFPKGAVPTDSTVRLRISVASMFIPERVSLYVNTVEYQMHYIFSLAGSRVYECTIKVPSDGGLLWYSFKVDADGETKWYSNNDRFLGGVGQAYDEKPAIAYQITVFDKNYKTPDWIKDAVVYQIFPDRFFRGGETPIHGIPRQWGDEPFYTAEQFGGSYLSNDFFGGTLSGIEQKLPYLADMGVTAIYLNPIFKAFSNHRYDTGDYETVDETLGTNEDFIRLAAKAKEYGIRFILDGVFSHTGSDSRYFNKYGHYNTVGAYQSEDSPFYSWYHFHGDHDHYDSWWGFDTLPNTDELDPEYEKYILNNPDSIIKRWIENGASGWRLDVADELPDKFIMDLRKAVKEKDPDALVIGEVWEDASNKIAYDVRRRYFTDTELDSVMNYPFREAIIALVQGYIGTDDFANRVLTIAENYPKEVTDCLMNSLSTHDTARILTVLTGAPRDMSREDRAAYVFSKEELQRAKELIKLAVMLQFFLPGSACIYYGDETGMHGFGDPFNRGYFDWDNTENEINDFYRAMAKIKNENKAFKTGEIKFLRSENGILVMERTDGENSVFAAINLSEESLKVNTTRCLACHNATCLDKTVYVQKNGFVIY